MLVDGQQNKLCLHLWELERMVTCYDSVHVLIEIVSATLRATSHIVACFYFDIAVTAAAVVIGRRCWLCRQSALMFYAKSFLAFPVVSFLFLPVWLRCISCHFSSRPRATNNLHEDDEMMSTLLSCSNKTFFLDASWSGFSSFLSIGYSSRWRQIFSL